MKKVLVVVRAKDFVVIAFDAILQIVTLKLATALREKVGSLLSHGPARGGEKETR